MENTETQQSDLLTEEVYPFFDYEKATTGQRFLNLIIDSVVIRLALTYITGVAVGYMLAAFFPEFAYSLSYEKWKLTLITVFILLLDYLLYYSLMEAMFRGKTIGKLITGTKAVNENGTELTFKNAFLRSACRLIPLEAFSGFGMPWHDSITNTMVIKTR